MLGASKAGLLGVAGNSGGVTGVTWDGATANVAYTLSNGDLDASKTSGANQWGDSVSVTAVTLTSAGEYEIDLEVVAKETGQRDNFGILKTSDVGTVSSVGFLSENISGRHYGRQPEGSLANGDIVTIRFDGPNSEMKILINNVQFSTTQSIDNTQSYYFTINNYGTGGTVRVREQVYAPATGFTKVTA